MMLKTLKFILGSQIKSSKFINKTSGFTLIELLVALVISFLIITPLLTFMVNVMKTDRDEQIKASSETEIQTGLNYIARDLQQAIYIYDADGINAIKSQLRYPSDTTTKFPLLVFWKRDLVSNVVPTASGNDDTFIYSLVAYYLIKDSSTTWSKAARIARWQIKDGVEVPTGVTCTGYTSKYASANNCPDPGFAPFNNYFEGSDSLEAGMNKWKKSSGTYTTDATVLIDYVDQTTSSPPAATCSPNVKDPNDNTKNLVTWSVIQPTSMTGFYVCVDKDNTTAQIFIRGNALARVEDDANTITYNTSKKTYFPTTSVIVQGRGFLYK
jgi:type II secretory pathway component PulJ